MANCPNCNAVIQEKYKSCSACGTILINLSTEVTAHINLLRKKIETDSRNVKLYIELGSIYQKFDLLYEALDIFQKAIEIDPNNFDAYNKSAVVYFKLKDLEKAEKSFRAALHISPHSEETLVGLFRVYYLENKITEAIAVGEKIIKAKPESVEFHMLLKNLYKQKGDKEKVFAELQKLELLIPDNEEVIKEIVQYFTDQNDMDGLSKYYNKMQEMNIEDTKLGFMIGKYYYENSQYDQAIEMFRGLLLKENVPVDMYTMIQAYLAISQYAKGDLLGAGNTAAGIQTEQINNTIDGETKKKLAAILYEIGRNKIQSKKTREAIPYFERAVIINSDNSEYKEVLEKTRTELALANKLFFKRLAFTGGGAIVVIVLVILLWQLSWNKLVIQVEPYTDVSILVDGKHKELYSQKPGVFESEKMFMSSHTVTIEKEGYNKYEERVTIGFGRNGVVRANLVPLYGVFVVGSQPESADVYIDENLVGKTPYVSGNIPAISHRLRIEFPGYQPYIDNVKISHNDTLDLGVVLLKSIIDTWSGKIGQDGVTYNASFEMEFKQKDRGLKIKYRHQPNPDLTYSGEINGIVQKNDFLADGQVNCRYREVFYWKNTTRRVIIRGKISDDWERIEGKHFAEGLGEHDWWAVRKK